MSDNRLTRVQELEAENRRLREELALQESLEGPAPNDIGVASRIAITRIRDTDWPELVVAVDRIPRIFLARGGAAAAAYCRTHIRTLIDAIVLTAPMTPWLAKARHGIHAMLSPGQCELLFRRDKAGLRARVELLECVERYAYSNSIHAVFARGIETPPLPGVLPILPGGR